MSKLREVNYKKELFESRLNRITDITPTTLAEWQKEATKGIKLITEIY